MRSSPIHHWTSGSKDPNRPNAIQFGPVRPDSREWAGNEKTGMTRPVHTTLAAVRHGDSGPGWWQRRLRLLPLRRIGEWFGSGRHHVEHRIHHHHRRTATPLLPGDPPDGFDVNVTNSTGQDLHVGTIHLQVMTFGNLGDAATSTGADIPGCLATWFSVPAAWVFDQTVPAHSTMSSTSIIPPPPTIAMATTDTDQDACQGASVGIEFST